MVDSKYKTFLPLVFALIAALLITLSGMALADTYTYDALGRLVSVTYSDGSSITYTYDAAGNRSGLSQAATP